MTRKREDRLRSRECKSSDLKDRAFVAVQPEMNAMLVMDAFNVCGNHDMTELAHELTASGQAVVKGDTRRMEATLMSQARALESMFVKLARQGVSQSNLPQYETMMKLALRAQNQCRTTLETLATVKNPPVVFAKQANVAQNQQVNNGVACAVESENEQPELSRLTHEQRQPLDARTLPAASASDSPLEAVATIDRPAHKGRKGKGKR